MNETLFDTFFDDVEQKSAVYRACIKMEAKGPKKNSNENWRNLDCCRHVYFEATETIIFSVDKRFIKRVFKVYSRLE